MMGNCSSTELPRPKPDRWRFQYSLRSLLLFVLLANVGMAWFGARWRAATERRDAVAAIRALGVRVIYDYEDTAAGPPGPAWARRLLGVDFFADVIRIIPQRFMHDTPGDSPITDACLKDVAELTCVERLDLQDSKVSDAGLRALVGLARLQMLNLRMADFRRRTGARSQASRA